MKYQYLYDIIIFSFYNRSIIIARVRRNLPENREFFRNNLLNSNSNTSSNKVNEEISDSLNFFEQVKRPTFEEIVQARMSLKITNKDIKNYYRKYPLRWAEDCLFLNVDPWENDIPPVHWDGESYPLWTKQREIFDNLLLHKKLSVKSGHGIGKSFIASVIGLTCVNALEAIVVTTAPSNRQVELVIWQEIHRLFHRANYKLKKMGLPLLPGNLNQKDLKISPKNYMLGFSTDNDHNFQGYHEGTVVIIVDEACGVSRQIFEQIEGILTNENAYVLLIGNPTEAGTYFFETFNNPKLGFHNMTVSCWDIPNVRHGIKIYPAMTRPSWPQEKKDEWGEDSNRYLSRVLGEFPKESTSILIPADYVREARKRELSEDKAVALGVDIARYGDDSSTCALKYASGKVTILNCVQGFDNSQVANMVKENYYNIAREEYEKALIKFFEKNELKVVSPRLLDSISLPINLYNELKRIRNEYVEGTFIPDFVIYMDGIGTGTGAIDILRHDNFPIVEVIANESAIDISQYSNRRIEDYWNLRKLFIDGKISIDDDNELEEELMATKYGFLPKSSKMYLVSKDIIKKEIHRSPDKIDAIMFSCIDESIGSLESVNINTKRKKVSKGENLIVNSNTSCDIILTDDMFETFEL